MRYILSFSFLLILFFQSNSSVLSKNKSHSQSLSLSISTDKQKIKLNKDLIVKVQITNCGDRPINLLNILHTVRYLGFIVIGPDGKEVEENYSDIDYGVDYYRKHIVTLYPGGFVGIFFNLTDQAVGIDIERVSFHFTKKGPHKIKAIYSVPSYYEEMIKSFGGDIWMGKLTSNEITVTLE